MLDMTDMDLVRDYAENQSESAFNELIHRHIHLVYSVAWRFVRNDEDARDVTQAVFIILARKAAGLRPKTILAGWLYETTRFTSRNFLTSKARRQRREQEAYMQSTLNDSAADWQLLEPYLEDAMSKLAGRDRALLVLRFYENKTGAEAAALLGIREDAAHKRMARAIEKLRKVFAQRGVTISGAAIAGAVSANSVKAAPVALVKIISAVAAAKSSAVSTSTLTLVKGALKFMAWSKVKTLAMGAIALLLVGTATGIVLFETAKPVHLGSQPAAPAADQPTPKGALLAMWKAMEAGDAQVYLNGFLFKTADDMRLRSVLERLVLANSNFKRALSDRFGADAANAAFLNLPLIIPPDVIQSAAEKIDGESATITFAGGKGGRPIQFTRVNGEWKMTADGFWHLGAPVMSDILERAVRSLNETAGEIPAGKYKSAMEAVDAMKQKAR